MPILLLRPVTGSVLAAVALAAAGGAASRAEVPRGVPAAPRPFETTLYFLTAEGSAPIGVRRTLAKPSPQARLALEALLAGPTPAERQRGLVSAIPREARLISLALQTRRPGTDAFVDLTGLPPVAGASPARRPSVLMRIRVITQIARTLIGLSDVARVWVRVNGRPWDLPSMDGRLDDRASDYNRLRGWSRICSGQRTPSERAGNLSRCFAALP